MTIPVDVYNPGQVFGCLGLLEISQTLYGDSAGGFCRAANGESEFVLDAPRANEPLVSVLHFLATAELYRLCPAGYEDEDPGQPPLLPTSSFPVAKPDAKRLPIRLTDNHISLDVSHWTDGSSRSDFKLYAGDRSAAQIVRAMLDGDGKGTRGIRTLWRDQREELLKNPFGIVTPMRGSFNFDARGAWNPIDVGYSLNDQKHAIVASPLVELLAAVGLENARPRTDKEGGLVGYSVWYDLVPVSLARPLLSGARFGIWLRRFNFTMGYAGKNKIVTFAEEEGIA
jgi:CRISPR-associated protein Csb3